MGAADGFLDALSERLYFEVILALALQLAVLQFPLGTFFFTFAATQGDGGNNEDKERFHGCLLVAWFIARSYHLLRTRSI
jgi:hypothetical protein